VAELLAVTNYAKSKDYACLLLRTQSILAFWIPDEVLDKPGGTTRIGFDIVTIPNEERGILSRKRGLPTTFSITGASMSSMLIALNN
jgi:hypothetical protein